METLQRNRTIYDRIRPIARQRAGGKNKAPQRTHKPVSPHFLMHRFSPVWCGDPLNGRAERMQEAFYISLGWVEKLHGFKIRRSVNTPFPYNIALDYRAAHRRLLQRQPRLELFITNNSENTPCLCTAEPWPTGKTVFFVPIKSLYELCRRDDKSQATNLLLSIAAYLYQILQVPYYRHGNTYMWYWYQMVEEWMDNEAYEQEGMEPEDLAESMEYLQHERDILERIYADGDAMQEILSDPCHLQEFENRIIAFKARAAWDKEVLTVAKDAYQLYQQFPVRTLICEIPQNLFSPEVPKNERINPEQYISFWWDCGNDVITDSVLEYIQSIFQECAAIDEPTGYQCFDRPQEHICHPTVFAANALQLIDSFCNVLINQYE